jgi:hypothetical protein
MFDNYTLKARFYPVIMLFLPLIVLGLFYSFEFQSVLHFFSSVGILSALTFLFSQLGRDQGKKKEPELWKNWGGTPSIQVLRLRDQIIDKHTKLRYHQKLQTLFPVTTLPDQSMETNNPNEADEVYRAWTQFLITKTRDTKQYSLLFKENINYGFRRNLWGLKRIAITLIFLLIIFNYGFWIYKTQLWNPLHFPDVFIYSSGVLVLLLLFWSIIVSRNWVKSVAFSYASRLCEAVETL